MGRHEMRPSGTSRGPSGSRKSLVVGDEGSGRCGICAANIAVRGVLDCCSHEYCFDCIENWSSVSNLCPLCKLQFRFISVENVYDQASDIVENRNLLPVKQEREEESWDTEPALPFSFPSFFIDEDAVACLEGNKCLVRAGVPLQDEDAADTSVACDSCDRWYHAGCVGFDPSISWGSWLCPRCSEKRAALRPPPTVSRIPITSVVPSPILPITRVVSSPMLPITSVVASPILPITSVVSSPILPITTVVSSSTSGRVPIAELAYNSTEGDPTVSVSVVGEGESALVLSTSRAVEPTVSAASAFSDGKCPDPRSQASIVVKSEAISYAPLEDQAVRFEAPGLSALEGQKHVASIPSSSKPEENDLPRAESDPVDRRLKEAISISFPLSKAELPDVTALPLHTVQPEAPKSDQRIDTELELGVSEDTGLPASYFDNVEFEEQPRKEKRKQTTRQDRDFVRAQDLPEPPRKIARSVVKKIDTLKGSNDVEKKIDTLKGSNEVEKKIDTLKGSSDVEKKIDTLKGSNDVEKTDVHPPKIETWMPSVDEEVSFTEDVPEEELMHLVKGERTGIKVKDEHTGGLGSNTAGGVRTRVVMRRERDSDGRASQIVEDIRRQMRAAAGYGASDDYGKVAVSDERFFSAFKAAMVRNQEQNQGAKPQGLKRRRNSWLDKMLDKAPRGKAGGVRESLTKKLYAGGVARKTWDRDWDISFWKEQSARIKKAKQEATDVVEGRFGLQVKEEDAVLKSMDAESDSLLSRLYVADTSLFPRDNDIKPLISLLGDVKEEDKPKPKPSATSSSPKSSKSQSSTVRKSTESKPNKSAGTSTNGTVTATQSQGSKVPPEQTSRGSPLPGAPKASGTSDPEEKKDKRQWALELLARRSGDAVTSSSSAKCQGGTKKESSLLVLVPEALRPTLPPDRRSRVPTAIRQSQLNRILEHYLRKAKLTNLKEGYKVKSVIASAVAKELEIYESSNSKGVYVNLCVRALAHQDEVRLQVTIPEPPRESDGAAAVTEALLATGLISDSPPESPVETDKARPSNQGPEASVLSSRLTSSADNPPSHSEVEDVVDVSQPLSSEADMDLEVKSCSITKPSSPVNKMKVVLTNRNKPPNDEKKPGECTRRKEGEKKPEDSTRREEGEKKPEESTRRIEGEKKPEESTRRKDGEMKPEESTRRKEGDKKPEESTRRKEGEMKPEESTRRKEGDKKPEESTRRKEGEMKPEESTRRKEGEKKPEVSTSRKEGEKKPEESARRKEGEKKPEESTRKKEGEKKPEESRRRREEGEKKPEKSTKRREGTLSRQGSGVNSNGKISNGQRANETAECSGEDSSGANKFGLESKRGESDGDDWMNSGKFPDLDSRIDKMRTDVLKMNSSFLSQFGEEHIFGGSLSEPTSTNEAGKPAKSANHASLPNSGGKEGAASTSVQKQVEAYVKEHLKPLYKSGVIKSDQFRYAVSKTASKVMQHHGDATSADFLIVEGSKVKKLADQYLQSFVQKK